MSPFSPLSVDEESTMGGTNFCPSATLGVVPSITNTETFSLFFFFFPNNKNPSGLGLWVTLGTF